MTDEFSPAPADAAPPAPDDPPPTGKVVWQHALLLALVAATLYLTGLGSYPLLDQDESRYGQIPREMLEANDWLTPRMFGEIYTDKPPLLYWQVMISYQLFGRSEFAARLPVGLAAVIAIVAIFWLVARTRSLRAGWISGLVLTTTLFHFAMGRYLVIDGVLSTCILLAVVLVYANLPRPPSTDDSESDPGAAIVGRRAFWRSALGYGFLGLATLAKGPVAGVLFGMPFVLFYVWRYGFQFWRPELWWRLNVDLYLWLGIPLTFAVALPWFLLMDQANPGFFYHFIVVQNLQRVSTDTMSRNQPFWYFFAVAIAGLFPWVNFLPNAVHRLFANRGWAAVQLRPLAVFALIYAVFPILFFSISHSKLIPYIAPSFPGFAIVLGLYFDELLGDADAPAPRIAAKVLAVAAVSMATAPLIYAYIVTYATLPIHVKLQWPALVCFGLPMLAMAVMLLRKRYLATRTIVGVTAGCMAAFLGLSTVSGFSQTLGEGVSHARLMRIVATEKAGDPRPLYVFRTKDEQSSFYFYHDDWQALRQIWASDGEANYIPELREFEANGESRVLMKRKYLDRFQRLFADGLDIQVLHEIDNSFELVVRAKPTSPTPPKTDAPPAGSPSVPPKKQPD